MQIKFDGSDQAADAIHTADVNAIDVQLSASSFGEIDYSLLASLL